MKKNAHDKIIPLTSKQLDCVKSIFSNLSSAQLIWISGYAWGLAENTSQYQDTHNTSTENKIIDINVNTKITVISASQTGNARRLAKQLYKDIKTANLNVVLFNAGDYKFKQIDKEIVLIIIISTYGEGEPPEEAIALYRYLFSNKAPKMTNTYFAIFGFGDRSYTYFAKAAKDFDYRLEELGAHRLYNRIDADVDFEKVSNIWKKEIVAVLKKRLVSVFSDNKNDEVCRIEQTSYPVYNQEFPLVACLSERQKITSRNSLKDVHHLEIDITDSNLCYQPGDALGVWYENDPDLVNELLELLNISGTEKVQLRGKSMLLNHALLKYCELTNNTRVVVENFANITHNKTLRNLLNNKEDLDKFILTTPIIEMLHSVSVVMTPQELLQALSPMKPRFYSIASAQEEVGQEAHITVSVIRYKINGRSRTGGASSYLVDRIKENDNISIFVASNNNFRLPKNIDIPVIMIGAGTGIAPFRAFMQQRVAIGASGKNWLFFGNLKFIDDFLYQIEWQRYFKDGFLTKINTAWSRDQNYKIYIQDKLYQNGLEVWSWIQEGAHIYICGDAKYMAQDVDKALIMLTSKHGGMNLDQANDFWNDMRVQHRYQRDIY